ncbi:MAG: FAD-dependent oxidoreductase [Negativicutes bacterium]|jgi:thioredoxin reductase (NADPH)|nr:FAD-dependent oxidoreductase [Negativicutes bacterium]MBP9537734.1 FAD-dependent oxidoreductase [Negativicutes bacterium]MBP9949656.1 FAD-dependent oxidoreductase [Negativicutes bacterium]
MDKEVKKPDVLIIGSGPAGLTAGIYAARFKLETMIIEDELIGGQIREAYVVENYPGFATIGGEELVNRMKEQALKSGAKIDEFDYIVKVDLSNSLKVIETSMYIYQPAVLIISAGMKRRELPIPEEKKLRGKGIHYCELCDGYLYDNKVVAVIGGGNSAVGAALALTKYATKVFVINRGDAFQADKTSLEKMLNHPAIEIKYKTTVKNAVGTDSLESLLLQDDNGEYNLTVQGVFVYIGSTPRTKLYADYLKLDENKNIIADESCQTNIEGVFVAGDVRSKKVRQLTTAVSDGTVAAILAEEYINKNR